MKVARGFFMSRNYCVLTPIPTVLNEIFKKIREREPDWTIQFDPSLTYTDAVRGVRAVRSAMQIEQGQTLPLFSYNVAPCIPYAIERRQYPKDPRPSGTFTLEEAMAVQVKRYKSRQCTIGIPFKLYFGDVVGAKTFEVMYSCDASVDEIKHVVVDLPKIGKFQYNLQWDDLSEVTYSKNDNHYVEVSSTLHVYGEFITLLDITDKLILQIHETINDMRHEDVIFSDKIIKPKINT